MNQLGEAVEHIVNAFLKSEKSQLHSIKSVIHLYFVIYSLNLLLVYPLITLILEQIY